MRAGHGADNVKGVVDIGHPVAHCLVQCILERAGTGGHAAHLGAQQFHPEHVDGLAVNVGLAHVHHALLVQAGCHGGRSHAMLAGAGLGNHPFLAHVVRQQTLAHGVVDLVRAGVVQVFALEQYARTATLLAEAPGMVQRRGTAYIVGQVIVQAGHEFIVFTPAVPGLAQLVQSVHEGFRHI